MQGVSAAKDNLELLVKIQQEGTPYDLQLCHMLVV